MLYLFDLDGTLLDTKEGIINALVYCFEKIGFKEYEFSDLETYIGPPLDYTFINELKFSREKSDLAIDYFREYYSNKGKFENKFYFGMIDLLKKLSVKHTLAVATSKPEMQALDILNYYNMDKYFKFIGGATLDTSRTKKHDVIEYVIDNLKYTDRKKIYMIGDRYSDIIGAKKSNIKSVGVLWGYGNRYELQNSKADYIVNDMMQLEKILL